MIGTVPKNLINYDKVSLVNTIRLIAFDKSTCIIKYFRLQSKSTRHDNFYGKFSICAEYSSRSIGKEKISKVKSIQRTF